MYLGYDQFNSSYSFFHPIDMRDRYSCILSVKTEPSNFKGFLEKVIDNIPYKAHSVDCFYNEFQNPPDQLIPFNKDFLLDNVSIQEMKGITVMSIHDQDYQAKRSTPFIRVKFNPDKKGESSISVEWIYFDNLNFLITDDRIISLYTGEDICLSFCNFRNQSDTYKQSRKKESWLNKHWGKSIIHKGIHFQAAPIMYFGKCYEPAISNERLLKFGKQLENDTIKVELADLYSNPDSYREIQKKFWKTMGLHEVIDDFKSKTNTDFAEVLKRRSELSKEK